VCCGERVTREKLEGVLHLLDGILKLLGREKEGERGRERGKKRARERKEKERTMRKMKKKEEEGGGGGRKGTLRALSKENMRMEVSKDHHYTATKTGEGNIPK
jgi:hypothetical protein